MKHVTSGNYYDEKALAHHPTDVSYSHMGLPSLTLNSPGASLGSSYSHRTTPAPRPVRAHLYVTNFTRGAQVWSGIRVKLGPEHGSKIGAQFRDIFYLYNAFSTVLTKLVTTQICSHFHTQIVRLRAGVPFFAQLLNIQYRRWNSDGKV